MSEHDLRTSKDVERELQATIAVQSALGDLEPAARCRVLELLLGLYREGIQPHGTHGGDATRQRRVSRHERAGVADFGTVAEALSAAGPPDLAPDKALIVAAYIQAHTNAEFFTSQDVNNELKNQGHGLANITGSLDSLIQRKPQLVIQLKKSGTTRQARKQYKVTSEGFRRVSELLDGGGTPAEGERGAIRT